MQEKQMAETRERRKTARKPTTTPTPKPDTKPDVKAGAPRKPIAEERSAALGKSTGGSNLRPERSPSPDEVRRLIEEAAYYRAKQRGFEPGHELEDWIQAESEVRRRLDANA
jgi:hypothetical protein